MDNFSAIQLPQFVYKLDGQFLQPDHSTHSEASKSSAFKIICLHSNKNKLLLKCENSRCVLAIYEGHRRRSPTAIQKKQVTGCFASARPKGSKSFTLSLLMFRSLFYRQADACRQSDGWDGIVSAHFQLDAAVHPVFPCGRTNTHHQGYESKHVPEAFSLFPCC